MALFDHQVIPLHLDSADHTADLIFWPHFLTAQQADNLLKLAIETLPWRLDMIRMFGKQIPVPRLQNWYADRLGTSYTYSGIKLSAVLFPDWMEQLRVTIQQQTQHSFNRALANYYRDGSDSVDWHADDELELGVDPVIASLSLGAQRTFQLRHNTSKEKIAINLPHGSLLLMSAKIQTFWQHRIAKVPNLDEPRVNFTFRYIEN